MIKIGLIGYGYWGPNLARNFYNNPDFELSAICDFSPDRLEVAGSLYPQAKALSQVEGIFDDKQ